MDHQQLVTPPDLAPEGLDEPLADEPCAGRDSACGHTCHLDNGSWTYETTMSMGGIENDVQAYCLCEHHDADD